WVSLQLPPITREGLAEVPRAVEQADADDRHTEVACRLEMIARQDAEPAGVLRERFGDTDFRAEAGDAGRQAAVRLTLIPARLLDVVGQVVVDVVHPTEEAAI